MQNETIQDIVIVGAGLAGLSCGALLREAGRDVTILEATDRVGGRVRTDVVEGFTLDHGFQVLLTAYPACKRMLDYDRLRLRVFEPGALIRQNGSFHVLSDPWRRPSQTIATAMNPVGTIADKLRIAKVRRQSRAGTLDDLYQRQDVPTVDYLKTAGFSSSMMEGFFRPFIGGVFLDETLSQSSRFFEFVFRMFAEGDVSVPAGGMAEIPKQLAQKIPAASIRLQSSVTSIDHQRLHLSDGSSIAAKQIVIATESDAAARLTGIDTIATKWNRTTNLYYAADRSPDKRNLLMLCGDEHGPVQTATVMTSAAPEYAPAGKSLISVSLSVPSPADAPEPDAWKRVDTAVRDQLRTWYGDQVDTWRHLATYQVPYGLPRRSLDPVVRPVDASSWGGPKNVWICGDHLETPSIHGAMNSGIRVAEAILS